MERRFTQAWDDVLERLTRGESLEAIMASSPTRLLIAALAGGAKADPLTANVLATEILNREQRARYLGAFWVSITTAILIFVLDYIYTGTILFLESGARAYILSVLLAATALLSLVTLQMYRGRFPRLLHLLRMGRGSRAGRY